MRRRRHCRQRCPYDPQGQLWHTFQASKQPIQRVPPLGRPQTPPLRPTNTCSHSTWTMIDVSPSFPLLTLPVRQFCLRATCASPHASFAPPPNPPTPPGPPHAHPHQQPQTITPTQHTHSTQTSSPPYQAPTTNAPLVLLPPKSFCPHTWPPQRRLPPCCCTSSQSVLPLPTFLHRPLF